MSDIEWVAIAVELFGGMVAISILACIAENAARRRRKR